MSRPSHRQLQTSWHLARQLPLQNAGPRHPGRPVPTPATLRSPENDRFPLPANGARFGDFEWQPSIGEDVVAEIAEFGYHDEARLVLLRHRNPGVPRHVHVSAGQLWTTGGEWAWRVWSITRSGEIAFSEVRTFVH